MTQNPYNVVFGRVPGKIIERKDIYEEIISSFDSDCAGSPLYLLAGARGSGKTVMMTSIANYYKEQDKWLVVDINPLADMLEQLAAALYQKGKLKHLFAKADFSFSFSGVSLSISGDKPVSNVFSLLDVMFEYLKKKKIKVLITVDEVTKQEHMKIFAHSFQSFLRNDYLVCLLMTGLYENFSSLENDESLTFLYRAPKIYMPPLNIKAIAYSYMQTLNMKEDDAIEAAKLTNGYAFAYQLLGYVLFDKNKKVVDDEVLNELDLKLDNNSYSKIFSELTKKEKEIVLSIAKGFTSNTKIMEKAKIKSNALTVYKSSLNKKGILNVSVRGESSFLLPRFKEFVLFNEKF